LELIPGTPAEGSGIRPGDYLLRLNDTPLDTREKLTILISRQPPGSIVILDYLHKGKEISVRLTLGERPAKE
jgi:S1-C subfamily serine protease